MPDTVYSLWRQESRKKVLRFFAKIRRLINFIVTYKFPNIFRFMSKSANMSASEKTRNFFKNGRIHHVKRSSCKGIEKQYVRYSRSSQKKAETNGWAKKNTAAVMVQSRMGSFPLGELRQEGLLRHALPRSIRLPRLQGS